MKKLLYLAVAALTVAAAMQGCKSDNEKESAVPDMVAYNPYVDAFTSGRISRFSPVYLVMSEDIPEQVRTPQALAQAIKITPAVEGEFVMESEYSIVFRPKDGFQRDKQYTVTADLSRWYEAPKEYKNFSYSFATLPLSLRASFRSIGVSTSEEGGFDIVCMVNTPDTEDGELIESLIKFSEPVEAGWEHDPDGRRHTVTITGIQTQDKKRDLQMSVAQNKLGLKQETLLDINIPGRNDFTVYSVEYLTEPQRYVEVTFTEELDPNQDLRGIVFLEENASEIVNIDANRLRLYPDTGREGITNVFIGGALRSRSGLRLGEDMVKQVTVSMMMPAARFVGTGNIIPLTDELTVPFQSVNLRGVVADVVRIFENNIGHFFQYNSLNSSNNLVAVGRPVASKVIFLDEDGDNLGQWNTFAIDMKDIIKPEPGAIYQISLAFARDLSVYPCEEGTELRSKEKIVADNEAAFKKKLEAYDNGYYYYESYDWYNYSWYDRNNPCTISYNGYRETIGTNIMATNIGLIAKIGEGGQMSVVAHNIINAQPERNVTVTVYSYQNRQLAKGTTNERGRVDLELGGAVPYYIVAAQGNQRAYLRVDNATSLSLSSFDVSGVAVQKGIKGFIYGERGIWRPGDTLHVSFMLNDRTGKIPANHPVTMELYNPLGQLYLTRTQTKNELGLYTFAIATEEDSPTGSWNIKANVGGATFWKNIRIETIKPNRLKIDMKIGDSMLRNREKVNIPMHVEWLQGATARNLNYEIHTSFSPVTTRFDNYKGYTFDNPGKSVDREEKFFAEGSTDDKGDVMITEALDVDNSAPGMLNVNFTTRVYEESGDFSIDGRTARFSPYDVYAGVKSPQVGYRQLDTGTTHIFDVVAVDPEGKPLANKELEVTAHRVSWYWWWSSDRSNLGRYVSDSYREPARSLKITTKPDGTASFNMHFSDNEWGTYFIQVKDRKGGHSTGLMSYFDWPYMENRRDSEASDAATELTLSTDSDEYKPGDKMKISFPSSEGSRAMVSIENGSSVVDIHEFACSDEETTVEVEVTEKMQPNVYIHVTLLQPYGTTGNDHPIRLYGIRGVRVISPRSILTPVIKTADEIKPEADYSVTISEKDGRQMAYTLAIVDEGLLDLTHFPTPDPWNAFNAEEALGVRTWDMYNYILGAYGGRIEQIFSIGGGDEGAGQKDKASTNRFRPVVQFEGPFLLKKGENKTHNFTMPNYNGRVRVMVVAGDGSAYGKADKSVMVRKPVMLLGTLPRVIGVNEEMVVPATVFATEKGVGKVKVTIKCSEGMTVKGPSQFELDFNEIGDKLASFRIAVGSRPGTGRVTITASGKGDTSVYDTDIEIRSVTTPQTKATALTIEPGQSWKGAAELFGMDGTNKLTLEITDVQPVNISSRLSYLLGYPHGCIEQITSKGFPQLYLKEFIYLTPNQQSGTEQAVKEVINRMRSYQTSNGTFSYWPGGSYVYEWTSPYATHFLLEAESKGYLIPSGLKMNAMAGMRRAARSWRLTDDHYAQSDEFTQAYRLYVLALSGSPETGAMNRLKESDRLYPMTSWMLAAAYAKAGRPDVARSLIEKTTPISKTYNEYDLTFGSDLRDKAIKLMVLTLLDDGRAAAVMANEISAELSSNQWLSTQTTAYALMAMSQYITKFKVGGEMDFSYACGQKRDNVKTSRNVWSEVMFENAGGSAEVEIKNNGSATLFARLIVDGIPELGKEEPYAEGIAISVAYKDPYGNTVNVKELPQGTAFTAEVTVSNTSLRGYRNLVLTQIFPSGWEILNTRFLNDSSTDSGGTGINYQDFRDDRVYSYVNYLPSGMQVKVSINLAAIYPGIFHLPPVDCRAMYENTVRANNEGGQVQVK